MPVVLLLFVGLAAAATAGVARALEAATSLTVAGAAAYLIYRSS